MIELHPFPNPQSGTRLRFAFKLRGNADAAELRVYTKAMTAAFNLRAEGSYGPGWNQAAFSAPALAAGLYYCELRASNMAGASAKGSMAKLYYLP